MRSIFNYIRYSNSFIKNNSIVWLPPNIIAVSKRDINKLNIEKCQNIAESKEFDICERLVGGRTVVHNHNTICFIKKVKSSDRSIEEVYKVSLQNIKNILEELDIKVKKDEPEDTFCPGNFSLTTEKGKILGLGQRVYKDCTLISGVFQYSKSEDIFQIYNELYNNLGLNFNEENIDFLDNYTNKNRVEISKFFANRI